jgi:hypothetical protein
MNVEVSVVDVVVEAADVDVDADALVDARSLDGLQLPSLDVLLRTERLDPSRRFSCSLFP